jgi:hypothetical protein
MPNPTMRNPFPRYWLTGPQQKQLDQVARFLPVATRGAFKARIAHLLHGTVRGQASDSAVRLALQQATHEFQKPRQV